MNDGLEEIVGDSAQPESPQVTPISTRADEWQAENTASIEAAMLGLPYLVSGTTFHLHPLSTARGSLLRRLRNEFVMGGSTTDIEDPFMACGRFIAVMSLDLLEAKKLVANPEALDDYVLEKVLDTIPMGNLPEVVRSINEYVKSQTFGQVHGEPTDHEGKPLTVSGPKN